MLVLPVVNCPDAETASRDLKKISGFATWVHIDIVDGQFAPGKTWGDPETLKSLKQQFPTLHFEVHLMVNQPEEAAKRWLEAGVDRVVIPLETMTDPGAILNDARRCNSEVMLSISMPTAAENLIPYFSSFTSFQVLAVTPGPSGQKFSTAALDKIRFIAKSRPTAVVEVDGGINLDVCKLVAEAGATAVASASYILNSPDPKRAYENLKNC